MGALGDVAGMVPGAGNAMGSVIKTGMKEGLKGA